MDRDTANSSSSGASARPELVVDRAPRFRIRALLHYREMGEARWHTAYTEDISDTGVLFRVSKLPEMKAAVEMILMLPADASGDATRALCHGHVVRRVTPSPREGSPAVAATLSTYRVLNGRRCEPSAAARRRFRL